MIGNDLHGSLLPASVSSSRSLSPNLAGKNACGSLGINVLSLSDPAPFATRCVSSAWLELCENQPPLLFIMTASLPVSPCSATVDPFSRSSTLMDPNAVSQSYDPMPSPQAWLASVKRRTMPSLLDPPGSPLDLLLPVSDFTMCFETRLTLRGKITRPLEDSQWNNRLSLLTHRYLREYGIAREDEIIEKAWKTLELFCVGEEAKKSLQVRTANVSQSTTLIQHGST